MRMSSSSKPPAKIQSAPRLSMRQGAIAVRGITRFLHCVRNHRAGTSSQSGGAKSGGKGKRGKKMGEKEVYKCSPKLMERLRRETLFTRMSSSSKPPAKIQSAPRLSMRQGAIAVRGITRFLHCVRNHRAGTSSQSGGAKSGGKGKRGKKMGEKEVYKCSPKLMERLRRETLFTRNEIDALYKIYKKLITFNKASSKINPKSTTSIIASPVTASEGIDRTVFREVLHNTFDIVTENMLMDRIFCAWDKQNCGLITLESWFQGMSLFLKGTIPKQIEYCFAVYDLNGDGCITKDEMFQLLRNCLIKFPQEEDPEESVKDLVDIVMRKMDKDKDGKVSLEDYQGTVAGEPLLLEAFGRCLPTERSKLTFLTTLRF